MFVCPGSYHHGAGGTRLPVLLEQCGPAIPPAARHIDRSGSQQLRTPWQKPFGAFSGRIRGLSRSHGVADAKAAGTRNPAASAYCRRPKRLPGFTERSAVPCRAEWPGFCFLMSARSALPRPRTAGLTPAIDPPYDALLNLWFAVQVMRLIYFNSSRYRPRYGERRLLVGVRQRAILTRCRRWPDSCGAVRVAG